ncbi:MAG: hypothetical protein ACLR3S_07575 [Clostridium fessum]
MATTHVNRALSLMALGRLDEADEELKESLTFMRPRRACSRDTLVRRWQQPGSWHGGAEL